MTTPMDNLTPEEREAVAGLLYLLRAIRRATGHGNLSVTVVDNEITEWVHTDRVRPKVAAPWRTHARD